MPITARELGKAAGFSVATVSRVGNNRSHLLRDETKQQIFTTAKELGYQPNLGRRSLRNARTNAIGLLVHNTI